MALRHTLTGDVGMYSCRISSTLFSEACTEESLAFSRLEGPNSPRFASFTGAFSLLHECAVGRVRGGPGSLVSVVD